MLLLPSRSRLSPGLIAREFSFIDSDSEKAPLHVDGRQVTKSLGGAPPGLLADNVFSCQMASLLMRSDFEVSQSLCFSCTKLGALHSHIHRTVEKAQTLKKLCS